MHSMQNIFSLRLSGRENLDCNSLDLREKEGKDIS